MSDRKLFGILLIALAGVAVLLELGRMEVYTENEGQRLAPPAEMLRSGDFVIPTLNGEIYLAKPPLLYWTIAGFYTAAGAITPFLGRLPVALSAVLLAFLIYRFAARHGSPRIGQFTALGLLASPYFLERARWAELDTPLLLTTFLAIALLYEAWQADSASRRLAFAVASGAALAAAALLKGPVPYLFVGAALLARILVESTRLDQTIKRLMQWTVICIVIEAVRLLLRVPFPFVLAAAVLGWLVLLVRDARHAVWPQLRLALIALVVSVALVAPWAAAVLSRLDWAFLNTLLHSEVVDRTHTATEINSGSPFYYLIALPVMLLPLGLLLPFHFSRTLWQEEGLFYRFCVLLGWLNLATFSLIAGKEYEYVMPAAPFLLIASATTLARSAEGDTTRERWIVYWRRFGTGLFSFAAVGLAIWTAIEEFHPLLLVETAVLGAIALLVLYSTFVRTRIPESGVRILMAGVLVVTSALLTRSFHYTGDRTPREIGTLCGDLKREGFTVESSDIFASVAFYTAIPIVEDINPESVVAKMNGDTPYFYLTREKFLQAFKGKDDQVEELVLSGPFTNKDLVLIGNAAAREAFSKRADSASPE
ncbi:MAG: glycosyltransferase family 39 protein [Candidatus Hydrogenedentes bacterium]|nr:glycosyltransferase family 39 protein [Candidatus Hydrogenedentota bacterium]